MITILNYGLGNIKAFANIYKKLNLPFKIASCKDDLKNATKIILPGVGSFDYAMQKFTDSGMRDAVENMVLEKKVPVIGICVGMQILADCSEEGKEKGLGWIKGKVRKIDAINLKNNQPLPHMGWNNLEIISNNQIFKDIENKLRFYFLHSYYFECADRSHILAASKYGIDLPSVINNKNIYGIQCHPEKSHNSGIQLLKNFGELEC